MPDELRAMVEDIYGLPRGTLTDCGEIDVTVYKGYALQYDMQTGTFVVKCPEAKEEHT